MTGAQYEGAKDLVYIWFGGMQALDMIYGLGCIVVGVLAIYTRMRLAGFYKNGPQMVNLCYIAGIAVGLIYIIGTSIILGGDVPLNYTSIFTNIGISAAMVVANTVYFKKRAHLFTK